LHSLASQQIKKILHELFSLSFIWLIKILGGTCPSYMAVICDLVSLSTRSISLAGSLHSKLYVLLPNGTWEIDIMQSNLA
jgi:hypothetical protein